MSLPLLGEDVVFSLPAPRIEGGPGVTEAMNARRSTRRFTDEGLGLEEVSLLLWASSGKTADAVTGATRTVPSAGGLYPVTVYLVARDVDALEQGVWRYDYRSHALTLNKKGDLSKPLSKAAGGQVYVRTAPACIVIAADPGRTARVYGTRGETRYVHMDAGHSAQNVYLAACSLLLGTVEVGAFIDERVKSVLGLEEDETPLLIMPVGHPLR
ncbi:MAG: SagB/ThcOx family dehydrogenase [Spirochaetes bacterium]|nr:SagB/ThcOx family dehydrogenase [Spirochaetota bacterium]